MSLLIVSFLAWVLTILAPCVLPLLPIILWASVEDSKDKYRPYIIIISLIFSIVIFSLLLKASTVFIWVNPIFWKLFSWVILIVFWILTIFPDLWKVFSTKIWFAWKSNQKLWESAQKKWYLWAILVWFSLWPVFSSCSPTYAIILAVILPVSFFVWLLNLFAYAFWLWVMLLLIALLGQKFVSKLKWASSPKFLLKKSLWIVFLLVWIAIILGFDKKLETILIDKWFVWLSNFEENLIEKINIKEKPNLYNNLNNKNMETKTINNNNLKEAYFAWWCFWCMEWIFESQNWVKEVITWYIWWDEKMANYDSVSTWKTDHREWIKIIYDPEIISYEKLTELFWTQIDPTDPEWQFTDKWFQYTTAMFYSNDKEKEILEKSKKILENSKNFNKEIVTKILEVSDFFEAEEYHQDYYKKANTRYKLYKKWSWREDFIEKNWKNRIEELEKNNQIKYINIKNIWYTDYSEEKAKNATQKNIILFFHTDWCSSCKSFEEKVLSENIPEDILILKVDFDKNNELRQKYNILTQTSFILIDKNWNLIKRWIWSRDISDIIQKINELNQNIWEFSKTYTKEELKQKLTPLQYKVAVEWWTEPPFNNLYWDNHEEWIYIDVIDWTTLFSSTDKFDSGTGWPSFTKPIDNNFIKKLDDYKLLSKRTEVKSNTSHLWHVFEDWPSESWWIRYCINSASLNFIPKEKLKWSKYEKYLSLFK